MKQFLQALDTCVSADDFQSDAVKKFVNMIVATARRRFATFYYTNGSDVYQAAYVIALENYQHLSNAEMLRVAEREIRKVAQNYGFRRFYQSGNRKTALASDTKETRNE